MADLEHGELVFLYHSGELEPSARAIFQAHLGSCTDCRKTLEDLDWARRLARDAELPADAALRRRALAGVFKDAPRWNWADWARSSGMGLGLAFAAGLFLIRASNPPGGETVRAGGLEAGLSELSRAIDSMDADLTLDLSNDEFEESWKTLNRSRNGLQSQLDELEEV